MSDSMIREVHRARLALRICHYLGMLEDGDNWSHSLGHIEELCREFQAAIDIRAGRAATELRGSHTPESLMRAYAHVYNPDGSRKAPTVADEQPLADLETMRQMFDSLQLEMGWESDDESYQRYTQALDRIEAHLRKGAT